MTPVVGRGAGPPAPCREDVARAAGVSRKTVSRVLNNEPYVSDEARRRVLQAAQELGYRLNHAARALASGRNRSIGVAALGSAGYGTTSLLVGIERAVRDAGYALRVVNTVDGDPEGIAGAVLSLLEQGVDGVVVSEPIVDGEVPVMIDAPVLFLGAPPAFACARTLTVGVGVGAYELARAATEHLLDLGHTTVRPRRREQRRVPRHPPGLHHRQHRRQPAARLSLRLPTVHLPVRRRRSLDHQERQQQPQQQPQPRHPQLLQHGRCGRRPGEQPQLDDQLWKIVRIN